MQFPWPTIVVIFPLWLQLLIVTNLALTIYGTGSSSTQQEVQQNIQHRRLLLLDSILYKREEEGICFVEFLSSGQTDLGFILRIKCRDYAN